VKNGITRENCYQFQMQRNQILKNIRKRSILENWTSWIKSFWQSKFKFEKINWWDSISNKSNKKNENLSMIMKMIYYRSFMAISPHSFTPFPTFNILPLIYCVKNQIKHTCWTLHATYKKFCHMLFHIGTPST
jgi:hypothetical protein